MNKIINTCIISICMLLLAACSDASGARHTLDNAGYTNVNITGYDFFACSQDDVFSTGFTATNPKGKYVEGTVCSGLLKGSTIRF